MKIRLAVLALTLSASALAGCSDYYYGAPPPPLPPEPRRPPMDACGAGSMQYLVGRPVSEAPQSYGHRSQRTIGQGSIINDLFDPQRLTILYDENTGRITRVRCG